MLVRVSLIDDSLSGEPVENFTISRQTSISPSPNDAMFLFRDSVINIVDINSEW